MNTHKAARISAAVLSLTALVAVAGCANGSGEPSDTTGASDSGAIAEMEPLTLIVSEAGPPTAAMNQGSNAWMEYVTEKTDGKITFEVYDTSTLHTVDEALSAIDSGLSDITLFLPALFQAEVPSAFWATGLGAFTGGTPLEMMAGSPAAAAVYQTNEGITEELAAQNAVYLGTFTADHYSLLCTEPVETLDDAKGKLARTAGGVFSAEAEAIGMTSVLMNSNEIYEGLQRGAVNCTVSAMQNYVNEGLAEVAKYYTPLPFSPPVGSGYIMNKEKYDALPDEAKKILADASPYYAIGLNGDALDNFEEWYTSAADEYGTTFVEPSDELLETLADFQASQGEALVDTAPASISDPEAAIALYRNTYDEWVGILADEFGLEAGDGSPEANLEMFRYLNDDFDWEGYRARWAEYVADLN